jgi:predicted MFS family arabinose efflux permease
VSGAPEQALFTSGERATLAILALATAVGASGLAAGGTAGALLGVELAGSDAAAGVPLGMLVVGSAAAAPVISYLTPRLGRERSLALGYIVGAVGAEVVVVAAVVESFALLLVGSFLLGAANSAIFLTRYAAADSVRPGVRGRALGTVFFATALGAIASPLLLGPGGELAELMGLPRLSGLYLVATAAFAFAGLTLVAASPSRVRESTRITRYELLVGLRATGARTSLLILGASNFVMVAVMAVTPVHMTEHAHHHLQFVGIVISLHVAGMFAPSPISGWLADRVGPITVAVIGFAFIVVAGLTGVFIDLDNGAAITALLVLLGLGWNFGIVGGSTLLSASTTPSLRPYAEGIGEVAMGLAAGLGAPIAGLVVAGGGFASLWLGGAVVATAVGVYILRSAQGRPALAGASGTGGSPSRLPG